MDFHQGLGTVSVRGLDGILLGSDFKKRFTSKTPLDRISFQHVLMVASLLFTKVPFF